uniref:Uncharacterized protein n=1 Tax=Photinus pyralis TaxID=7054 RepID=A0A1Y1LG74_PHOPY
MRVASLFSSMATHFPRPVRPVRSMCHLGRLVDLLLLINTELTRATVDQQEQTTDDREDLEEIVLGKVLVWVVLVEGPEVVDKQVKDAQNNNEKSGAELGLEPDNNHDASAGSEERDQNAPNRPLASKDKSDKEEDE